MIKGSIVALITPFRGDAIDEKALETLVNWQINEGTHGIVACGSTGEGFALSHAERQRILEICVSVANKKIPIIAGTGAITTEETLELTRRAKQVHADAVLIVSPPYIRPTQEALFAHYKTIHDAMELPIFLYNNPGRTCSTIANETIARLSKLERIVGIKDSTRCVTTPVDLKPIVHQHFSVICGEDDLAVAFLANGGKGCISITANVAPRLCADLYNAWEKRDLETVSQLQERLMPLHRAVTCESNPIPIKYAVSSLGLCADLLRAPLSPASIPARAKVDEVIQFLGLAEQARLSHG